MFSRRNVPFIAVPVRAKKRLGRTSQTQLRAIITRSFTTLPPPSPLVTAGKEQNGSSVFYKKEAARHSWWRPPRVPPRCRGAGVPVSVDVKRSFLKGTVMQLSTCIAEAFSFLCRLFASGREAVHGS